MMLRRLIAPFVALFRRPEPIAEMLAVEAGIDEPESVRRARSMVGHGKYRLGAGDKRPDADTPFDADGASDCSGFVLWCHGIPRQDAVTKRWLNTDAMEALAKAQSIAWTQALLGDVVVYGAGAAIGHCGLVSAVDASGPTRVIHCSARGKAAVKDEGPALWLRKGARLWRP